MGEKIYSTAKDGLAIFSQTHQLELQQTTIVRARSPTVQYIV